MKVLVDYQLLAQKHIGNNIQKLENEIRKLTKKWNKKAIVFTILLKKLVKTIYKKLIKIIQRWKWSIWTLKILRLVSLKDFVSISLTNLILKTLVKNIALLT